MELYQVPGVPPMDTMRSVTVRASGLRGSTRPAPAGQADLRGHNLALITRLIASSTTAIPRAELAARTGLGRATVSRLTQELVEGRLLEECDPVTTDQRGRPATPLELAHGTVAGLGLEANVWYAAGRALDLAGGTVGEFRITGDFSTIDAAATLSTLGDAAAQLVRRLRTRGLDVCGATLAIPGMVSADGDHVNVAPNLGWHDLHPLELLGKTWDDLKVPTIASNDANLQATTVAFRRPGQVADHSRFLYLAGDIGIGGALVTDGRTETGEHGWAGEIGHVSIEPDGTPCHCGSTGCLETYAGQATLMAAIGLTPQDGVDRLIAQLDAGDPRATAAVERAGWALGVGIANVLNVADVSRVVLGTSLGRLLPWLEPHITPQLRRRVLGAQDRDLRITQGANSDAPACTGGALNVLNRIVEDPAGYLDARSVSLR